MSMDVFLISTVFCLVQLPRFSPTFTRLTIVDAVNDLIEDDGTDIETVTDIEIIGKNIHINSKALLYESVAFFSFAIGAAVLVSLSRRFSAVSLLLSSLFSLSRPFLTWTRLPSAKIILAALAGIGYGGAFVSTCMLINQRSRSPNLLARNFATLVACGGASYALFVGILNTQTICESESCLGVVVTLQTIGCALSFLVVLRTLRWRGHLEEDGVFLDVGGTKLVQNIPISNQVTFLVALLFYSYSHTLTSKIFSECWILSNNFKFHLETLVPFGIGMSAWALHCAYYHSTWMYRCRTIISTTALFLCFFMAIFLSQQTCETGRLWGHLGLIPVYTFLVGQGLASLSCEVYPLTSIIWKHPARFTLIIVMEAVTSVMVTVVPAPLWLWVTVSVPLAILYIVVILQTFSWISRYRSRVERHCAEKHYGTMMASNSSDSSGGEDKWCPGLLLPEKELIVIETDTDSGKGRGA